MLPDLFHRLRIWGVCVCRGRMTNSCMISCCHSGLGRHLGMLMFHSYCDCSLVMITLTSSFPLSLTITSSTMPKLLACNCLRFCVLRNANPGNHFNQMWTVCPYHPSLFFLSCSLKTTERLCSNKQNSS